MRKKRKTALYILLMVFLCSVQLFAEVLLVDDYLEIDENGSPLEYQQRQRFYQRWGVHHFDYDVWVVAEHGGFPDSSTVLNYQALLIASDGDVGLTDGNWWYEVGGVNGGAIRYYLENGGHLLAVGQLILLDMTQAYPPDVQPGDFEYDWLGIDSTEWCFDYWWWFTWAVGEEPGYPDSMMIDSTKLPEQDDYAMEMTGLRQGVDTLFSWGLYIDGSEPGPYGKPVGIIYRPAGEAVTSLISFSLYYMPNEQAQIIMANILRDEFGCTYYADPPPLPPWHVYASALSDSQIALIWDSIDEDDVVTINVYRAIFDGPLEFYISLDAGSTEFIDDDVAPAVEYNYRLTTVDQAEQESDYSHWVTEYGGRPRPPTNLRVESGYELDLIWTIPDDALIESFNIYRASVIPDNFLHIGTVTGDDSTFSDGYPAGDGREYHYYVTSVNSYDVESYPSDIVSGFSYVPGNRSKILVVNGVDWDTYGYDIIDFYQDNVPVGYQNEYRLWDLFGDTPYLGDMSDSLCGVEALPAEVFDAFEKIVWVGNRFNGDEEHWHANEEHIMEYLNTGGNLMLLGRQGHYFFFEELWEFCGIEGYIEGVVPDYLVAMHDSLSDIGRTGSLSFTNVFDIDESISMTLYEANNAAGYAAGFWTQGPMGSGNFIHLDGRPYRLNNYELRQNIDVMLRYFFEIPTDIEEPEIAIPDRFELAQNYPNPFNSTTIIKFGVPSRSAVKLEVFDILGRRVNTLINDELDAGYHEIRWNGKTSAGEEISSGIYFYRISSGDFIESKKMVILK